MNKKLSLSSIIILVLLGTIFVAFRVQTTKASGTIYIRSDGSIYPDVAPISSNDNITYRFTGNIGDCITVERDNIIVDGEGFSLEGAVSTYFAGIYLRARYNVTIRNLTIKRFRYGVIVSSSSEINIIANDITVGQTIGYETGVYLLNSSKNTVLENRLFHNTRGIFIASSSENNISGNEVVHNENGIWLENSSNNTLSENNVSSNAYDGIFLYDSLNNRIFHNNFVDNVQQVNIVPSGYPNSWDNGLEGNYWSNYTGTDTDYNGVGDTPHVIDAGNTDYYPLMGPFHGFNTSLGKSVNVISNSTIDSFRYFESNSTIRMHVSNMTA
ncbi:MAG: right-handed parallel beta-helix repeat-containing protein, partial [Candidatus Bathyarchaeota archaeon]